MCNHTPKLISLLALITLVACNFPTARSAAPGSQGQNEDLAMTLAVLTVQAKMTELAQSGQGTSSSLPLWDPQRQRHRQPSLIHFHHQSRHP
jgi:hypothetical protein